MVASVAGAAPWSRSRRSYSARSVRARSPAHIAFLREAGVTVLFGEGGFVPHKPKHGDLDAYPWQAAIDALPA